jgi:hypothetical protein
MRGWLDILLLPLVLLKIVLCNRAEARPRDCGGGHMTSWLGQ